MINFSSGFNITNSDSIDARILLSKQDMIDIATKRVPPYKLPDKYFCVCKDDGKLYLYDKENEISEETGKHRVLDVAVEQLKYRIRPEGEISGKWQLEQSINGKDWIIVEGSIIDISNALARLSSAESTIQYIIIQIDNLIDDINTKIIALSDAEIIEVIGE